MIKKYGQAVMHYSRHRLTASVAYVTTLTYASLCDKSTTVSKNTVLSLSSTSGSFSCSSLFGEGRRFPMTFVVAVGASPLLRAAAFL